MRTILAVTEYTVQLALIALSGILALMVKGKTKMAAQRRYRNRRTPDPMNFTVGPKAVVAGLDTDEGSPSVCTFYCNAAMNLAALDATTFAIAGKTIAAPFTRITDTSFQATVSPNVTAGESLDVTVAKPAVFGPNITGMGSTLAAVTA